MTLFSSSSVEGNREVGLPLPPKLWRPRFCGGFTFPNSPPPATTGVTWNRSLSLRFLACGHTLNGEWSCVISDLLRAALLRRRCLSWVESSWPSIMGLLKKWAEVRRFWWCKEKSLEFGNVGNASNFHVIFTWICLLMPRKGPPWLARRAAACNGFSSNTPSGIRLCRGSWKDTVVLIWCFLQMFSYHKPELSSQWCDTPRLIQRLESCHGASAVAWPLLVAFHLAIDAHPNPSLPC